MHGFSGGSLRFVFGVLVAACILAAQTANSAYGGEDEEKAPSAAELAESFRKHCVRVYVNGKSHNGSAPSVGEFAADIRNERSTPIGGYWWDERHVVIEDPTLQDNFIRSIEIGLPFSDLRFPARVAGRFVKLQAILLEVLPGEDGISPQAFPLQFVDGDIEKSVIASYQWDRGEWRIEADGGLGPQAISDAGAETAEFSANGVFVNKEGEALGLAFGERVLLGEDGDYWSGASLHTTPLLTVADINATRDELATKLSKAVLETRFFLRVKVEDEDEDRSWMMEIDDGSRGGAADFRAAGLVVGKRHLFVPLPLQAEGIARIEEISVIDDTGRELKAKFAGALRDYMAVLIETEEDLSDEDLPEGFAKLNPMLVPEEAFLPDSSESANPEMKYFQRWRIDYGLGRRREIAEYDRWLGSFRGYRGDTTVLTLTNEEDGSMAFDVDGRLIALALTPRTFSSRDGDSYSRRTGNQATPGFRPLEFLYDKLHDAEVFDPALAPVAEDAGRRLIDFGVEYQGLDANTARLFAAAEPTRGGRIGVLVTHVYPGSTTDQIGIREHDILLRIFLDGKSEPTELSGARNNQGMSMFDFSDMSSESFQRFLAFMPPPWPSRDNAISSLLTAAGPGRPARVDYVREGEAMQSAFTTSYTDADYRNARREKYPVLGLTIKPVTYEVARYFRRTDSSGVIISKVEEGGKASVAGLHHYLLVTHVDGRPVAGMDDFREKLNPFEEGTTESVELTVDGFGKTRLVKIE